MTVIARWHYYAVCLLLAAITTFTLVSSQVFIYASLTPVFLYCLGISMLIGFTGLIILTKQQSDYHINFPSIAVIVWLSYSFLNGIINNNLNLFHYYLLVNMGFFLILSLLLKTFPDIYRFLFFFIYILAAIESVICIGQYLKLFNSLNAYFTVTGSWENPNVTAMFLVMALPICWFTTFSTSDWLNKVIKTGILLIVVSVFLLKCRTAIIGMAAEILIIANYQFNLIEKFTAKNKRSLSILIAIFFLGIIIPIAGSLYKTKQASADGRKLIYKISAQMILNKPITGYGYGTFERNYNLAQADYFKNGNGSDEEAKNADFVKMGYNEVLQNGVEGGLIGLVLLLLVFYSLLTVRLKNSPVSKTGVKSTAPVAQPANLEHIAAYSGIAAFAIMSLFNFSVQAVPAMCLFIFYAAMLAGRAQKPRRTTKRLFDEFSISINRMVAGTALLCVGLWSGYCFTVIVYNNYLNKKAQTEAKAGSYQNALRILNQIGPGLNTYESYWTNYANAALGNKDLKNAALAYGKASCLTSNPVVYIKMAQCYEAAGNLPRAELSLQTAKYIQPNHLLPRFSLMNLYLKMNDTSKALSEAKQLADVQPKIPSKEADFYKYSANVLMSKLGHPHNTAFNKPFGFRKAPYLSRKKYE